MGATQAVKKYSCLKMKLKRCLYSALIVGLAIATSPFTFAQGASAKVDQDAASQQGLYDQALDEYANGNVNVAIIHVKNMLKEKPDHLPARLLFGNILLEYGELEAAQEQFQRAINLRVDPTLVLLPLANSLILQSKYKLLLDQVKTGNYRDDFNGQILSLRAKAYLGLQQIDDAHRTLLNANQLAPENIDVLLGLSSVALKRDDQVASTTWLAQAKVIAPENSMVWFYEGESFRRLRNVEKALASYQQALALNNDNISVLKSRAAIYLDTNELELARADITRVLAIQPEDPVGSLLRSVYLARTNQHKAARAILNDQNYKFSQLPDESVAQFAPLSLIHGVSQFLTGNFVEAKSSLTLFLAKNPSSIEARSMLAEIEASRSEHARVIKLLEFIEPQFLSEKSALVLMSAYFQQENYLRTSTLPEQLNRNVAKSDSIKRLQALALLQLGESRSALELLTGSAQESVKNTLTLGYIYLQFGFFEKAQETAIALVDKGDNSLAELNFIGVAFKSVEEFNSAEEYFKRALDAVPQDVISLINLIKLYIEQNQWKSAANTLSTGLQSHPNNTDLITMQAQVLQHQGEYQRAIEIVSNVLSKDSTNLAMNYRLLNLYLMTNQPEQALEQIKIVNRLEPLSPVALVAKSKALLQLGNKTEAAKSLRVLYGLVTDEPKKLVDIGKLQAQAEDWIHLQRTVTRLSENFPETPELSLLKAHLMFASGEEEQAIALLNDVKTQSNSVASQRLQRDYFARKGDLENASKYAEGAYLLAKSESDLRLWARYLWQQDNKQEALAVLERHLNKDLASWQLNRLYANLLEQYGDASEAIVQYQRVLEREPEDILSLNNLALLLSTNGDLTRAETYGRKAVSLAPNEAKINDTLGWILVQQGKAESGLSFLRESYLRNTNNPTALYHMAIALEQTGRVNQSIESLEQALAISTSFNEADDARKKLAQLKTETK